MVPKFTLFSASLVVLSLLTTAGNAQAAVEGIDVSEFQGNISWSGVAGSGVKFAIIRVSDGLQHPDPKFDQNWSGAPAAGLIRGVYQFFRPAQNATNQANYLLSKIGNTLHPGDLPPALDVETRDGLTGAQVDAQIGIWVARVKAVTGRNPMVYTSPGWWNSNIGVGQNTFSSDLWVAHWFVSSPTLPSGWSSYKVWQYDDNGVVPGITANVVDQDRFNGTLAQLQAYAHVPEPSTFVLLLMAAGGLALFGRSRRKMVHGSVGSS